MSERVAAYREQFKAEACCEKMAEALEYQETINHETNGPWSMWCYPRTRGGYPSIAKSKRFRIHYCPFCGAKLGSD